MHSLLSKKTNEAALLMSNEIGADYDDCKACILLFLGAEDEAQLYNLELKNPGEAKTRGVRHIVRNGENLTWVDLAEALTTIAGLAFLKQNIDGTISAIAGGLFLIKFIKNATTVELSASDASVVWALHQRGGTCKREDLLFTWGDVVSESSTVDATTTREKLDARLQGLIELGCVREVGGYIMFAEPVEIEA